MSDVNVGNEEQSSSNNSFVIRMVANVLGKLIDRNTNIQGQENILLSKFQSSYVPEVAVEQYLQRIRSYSRCSDACFIMSLVYLDKLIEKQCLVLTSLNVHRLMITCVMLSAKFHDDLFYSNAYFSKLGGVSLRELNVLESDMLNMLSFSLFVDVESYFRYFTQLQKYFLHLNMDFVHHHHHTISPAPVVVLEEEDFYGRSIIIYPPRPPSTPSPCLIPHNNNLLHQGHYNHHHNNDYSNNDYNHYNNSNDQCFPFSTMYATTDPPSGSIITTTKSNSSSSTSLLSSSSWMTEHEEEIPWRSRSCCELSHDFGSSSSSSSSYDDSRKLGPNPSLGLPFSRDDDDDRDGDDMCGLPFIPFVNNQRDKHLSTTTSTSHAIHSNVPEALHSGFGFYHHHPPPHHHHQPPPPHHHHHQQLSYQMPGFYPDNTIHRDWPIQYHNPSDYASAAAAIADDDDDYSSMAMMMMNTHYDPSYLDPNYRHCSSSYLDSDYPQASSSNMILYAAPPMVWSNIY